MANLTLKERFIGPRTPGRRPRRAAYALPTLFTAGNIFLGFLASMLFLAGAEWAARGHRVDQPDDSMPEVKKGAD